MKTEIDLPFIPVESAKKCGCGGHDKKPAPEEQPHTGCGCHGSSAPAEPGAHSCGGGCRGIRTPRRIHAALGLLLTFFLFFHLGIAALGWLPNRYNAAAAGLKHFSDRFPVIEAALLLLIAAQTIIGIRLLIRSGLRYRSSRCKEDGPFRYFLQRWSAAILLVFILAHLAMFKLRSPELSFVSVSRRFTLGGNPFVILFYILALAGIAFHAGNGLWTGASVLGWRDRHPRFWLGMAGAGGAMIALLGFIALLAFAG
jgi:succinate dehydrogenase/fumarate reductase cytochrome b subunit